MPVSYLEDGDDQQQQRSGHVAYEDQQKPQHSGGDTALGIGGAGVLGLIGGALFRRKFPGVALKDAEAFLGKLHGSISKEIDEGGLPKIYDDFKEYVRAAKAADPDARVPNLADYIHSRSAEAAPQTAELLAQAQHAGPNTMLDKALGLEKPRLPAQIAADARSKELAPDVNTFSAGNAKQDDLTEKVAHLAASVAAAHMPIVPHGFLGSAKHLIADPLDPFNLSARSGNRVLFEEPRFNLDGDYVPNENVQRFVDERNAPPMSKLLRSLQPSPTARTGAVAGMALGAGADGTIMDPTSGLPLYGDQDQQ